MRISDWSSDVCSSDLAKVFAASPETARRVMIARFKGQRTYAEVMKMRTLDGRLLDVRITITYPAPPARLDVTLICLEDLTDQRSTEYQLRQLQAEFATTARILTLGQLGRKSVVEGKGGSVR